GVREKRRRLDDPQAVSLSASSSATPGEAALVDWLKGQSKRAIETACARVFLAGDVAWKVKRNADLGYADFRTVERRKWALDRELSFNKSSAPDIYRRVRAITRDAGGGLAWNGPGEAVD